jgi:hypothetical protein
MPNLMQPFETSHVGDDKNKGESPKNLVEIRTITTIAGKYQSSRVESVFRSNQWLFRTFLNTYFQATKRCSLVSLQPNQIEAWRILLPH